MGAPSQRGIGIPRLPVALAAVAKGKEHLLSMDQRGQHSQTEMLTGAATVAAAVQVREAPAPLRNIEEAAAAVPGLKQ